MGLADELEKLASLRAGGAINDEEYQKAKAHVLNGAPTGATKGYHEGYEPSSYIGVRPNLLQRLTRSKTDSWAGGVCGGLAAQTDIPSWFYRILFTAMFFAFGFGLIPYVLMWIFIPAETG